MMTVIYVKDGEAETVCIDGTLEDIQGLVHGYVEEIQLATSQRGKRTADLVILCDEDASLMETQQCTFLEAPTIRTSEADVYNTKRQWSPVVSRISILNDFVVCAKGPKGWIALTDTEIKWVYRRLNQQEIQPGNLSKRP